jgi:ribosomal protein S18 acetylase RimI-like enzyme
MSEITIGRARPGDLGEILRDYERFWGEHTLPRYLHHPMFVYEFGDTAFVARRADGQIAGYLLGFVAPTGDGYIHFVAVRDDARGCGLARQLYEVFAAAAAERGATALKAITGPNNEGSIEFHRKLGFEMTHVDDYGGTGRARLIMRRPLKDFPAPGHETA